MAVKSLNIFDSGGRFRPVDQGAVYCLISEVDESSRVVKIGHSQIVYDRYSQLLTAVPFPSSMRFFWTGSVKSAKKFERHLHAFFKDRNTTREWFRFYTAEIDAMLDTISVEAIHKLGRAPKWHTVTEQQVADYQTARRA